MRKDKMPMLSLRSSANTSFRSEIRFTNAMCSTLVPRKPTKASINSWQRFENSPPHVSSVRLRTKCDRIVTGLRDHGHRERLLRESTLTLQKAIDICWTNEMAASQRHKMEQSGIIHFTSEEKKPGPRESPRRNPRPTRPCKYCGKRVKLRLKGERALNEVFTAYLCDTCSSCRFFCFFQRSMAENPASKHHVMFYATDSLEHMVTTTTFFMTRMQVMWHMHYVTVVFQK